MNKNVKELAIQGPVISKLGIFVLGRRKYRDSMIRIYKIFGRMERVYSDYLFTVSFNTNLG